jgi:hypothetical protein
MQTQVADWAAVAVAILALFVAAWATFQSRKATEAQLLLTLLSEYASPDMTASFWRLSAWADSTLSDEVRRKMLDGSPEEVIALYRSLAVGPEPYSEKLDMDRRRIHWFFKKAWQLHERGYLWAAGMEMVASTNGYGLMLRVVWPLSRMVHYAKIGPPPWEHFAWIERMRFKFKPARPS